MNRISHDRNGTSIFAERSQKNLDFIIKSAAAGCDVHPVTQVVSALLGIIVFPWEIAAFDNIKKQKLPILVLNGWPKWTMSGTKRIIDLKDLIYVLRNAIAHGRVAFDSDSREPHMVTIFFEHIPEGKTEPNWVGKITCDQLIEFCRCFSSAMLSYTT